MPVPKYIKSIIMTLLQKFGFVLFPIKDHYNQDGLFTVHSTTWRKDPKFQRAYQRGLLTTNGDDPKHEWRVHIALWCASHAARLSGDFVECGVFVGFISSSIMEYLDWNSLKKQFYLVDSFEGPSFELYNDEEIAKGMVTKARNLKELGGYHYPIERVRKNFSEWKNVNFIKGFIPDVLPQVPAKSVCYLHIDLNCAAPEVEALAFFWEKIVPGGIILLDDYAYSTLEVQNKEMNKFAARKGISIASLPTGQGLIIKSP